MLDVGIFNLPRLTVLAPKEVATAPIIAKGVSTSVAIVFNLLSNWCLSFRTTRHRQAAREAIEFIAVSIAGGLLSLLRPWFSHYVLGFTSVLANNISSNAVGLALCTTLRRVFDRW